LNREQRHTGSHRARKPAGRRASIIINNEQEQLHQDNQKQQQQQTKTKTTATFLNQPNNQHLRIIHDYRCRDFDRGLTTVTTEQRFY
jgi:hypothetical protein